jgi:polysaccharide export outer membrane protein
VGLPGAQPLVGALTVLQAVMAAQGLKDTAQAGEVIVLRAQGEGEPSQIKVDLAGLMSGRPGARDLALMPQDVVLVPRSGVASLNVWVDQYLRRNLPINFGVNYTINQNRGQQ